MADNSDKKRTSEEIKERRKKHNEVEIRRRKRIKDSFAELGRIVGCDSRQKRQILDNAIDMIRAYEQKIETLRAAIDTLNKDGIDTEAVVDTMSDPLTAPDNAVPQDLEVMNDLANQHGSIFHLSWVPMVIAGFDGRLLDCNEGFARLFNIQRNELLGGSTTTLFSLISPNSLSYAFSMLGSLMNGRASTQNDLDILGSGNQPVRVRFTVWSVKENGKPTYFMGMMLAQSQTLTSENALESNEGSQPPPLEKPFN